MKKLLHLICISFLTIAIFSCNHSSSDTLQNGGEASNDPDLIPLPLIIDNTKVENNKVKIGAGKLEVKDIIAKFKYGSVPEEQIDVVILNAPFIIEEGETKELNLKVEAIKGKHKSWQGSVTVTRGKILDAIMVLGGRVQGKEQRVFFEGEELISILNGEEKTIEILGPLASVYLFSEKIKWDSARITDKGVSIFEKPGYYKSYTGYAIMIAQSNTANFEIVSNGKTITGKLKLSQKINTLVDHPALNLYIDGTMVTKNEDDEPKGDLLELLCKGGYEISVGKDIATIQIASPLTFRTTINGRPVFAMKNIIPDLPSWHVAFQKIEGITDVAQDVVVEIISLIGGCQPVTWRFKIKK